MASASAPGVLGGRSIGASWSWGKRTARSSLSRASFARGNGTSPGDGVEERRGQAEHVGGWADVRGIALLGRHVRVGADLARDARGAVERAGDAEVDQPRRHAHDDVVGLDVEVDPAGVRHVLDRRRDVQCERNELLDRQRPAAADERAQRRALEVLDQHVGMRSGKHRVVPADEHGMGERLERLGLLAQRAQLALVLGPVGTEHLRDHEREVVLVPDQEDLVRAAAAEVLEDRAPRGDDVTLGEPPRRLLGALGPPQLHLRPRGGRLLLTAAGRGAGAGRALPVGRGAGVRRVVALATRRRVALLARRRAGARRAALVRRRAVVRVVACAAARTGPGAGARLAGLVVVVLVVVARTGAELSSRTALSLPLPLPPSASAVPARKVGVAKSTRSARNSAKAIRGRECWSSPGSPLPSASCM